MSWVLILEFIGIDWFLWEKVGVFSTKADISYIWKTANNFFHGKIWEPLSMTVCIGTCLISMRNKQKVDLLDVSNLWMSHN